MTFWLLVEKGLYTKESGKFYIAFHIKQPMDQQLLQRYNEFEQETLEQLARMNRSILEAFKFNFIYNQQVPEEKQKQTAQQVRKYRDQEWKKALQKANGDTKKAYQEYTKDAFFV